MSLSNQITQPFEVILNPNGGGGSTKPAANAEFHVGEIDKDPIQYPRTDLAYRDESGTERDITSPIYTNNSGAFVASKNSGTIIQPYMKDGSGYSVLITGRRGEIYSSKHVGEGGSVTERINAGDSQVVDGLIFPERSDKSFDLGEQSISVIAGVSRIRVDDSGHVNLLYLWEPSGDFASTEHTVTKIEKNEINGYVVTTDKGEFEFLTHENYTLRHADNIDGWGADHEKDSTKAMLAHRDYIIQRGSGSIVGTPGKTYLYTNHKEQWADTPDTSYYGHSQIYQFYKTGVNNLVFGMAGCKIKVKDGSHYGCFNPNTGAPIDIPPSGEQYDASPGTLFNLWDVDGVSGFPPEVDGNNENMIIGGKKVSSGIQIQHTAMRLRGTTKNVMLFMRPTHHMGLDGIAINVETMLTDVDHNIKIFGSTSEFNGRQGLSLSGGAGVTFYGLKANNTGMGAVSSSPSAGVDIEPESGNYVISPKFFGGEAINNQGVGLLVWDPDKRVSGFYMRDFTLWGTSNHAAWLRDGNPDDPYILEDCKIHGQIIYCQNVVFRGNGSIIDNLSHPDYGYYKTSSRTISSVDNALFKDMSMNISKQLVATGGSFDNVEIVCAWDGPEVSPSGGQCLNITGDCSRLVVKNKIKNVATEDGRFFVTTGSGFNGGFAALTIDNGSLNSLRYASRTGPDGEIPIGSGLGFKNIGISAGTRLLGQSSTKPTVSIGDTYLGEKIKSGDTVFNLNPKTGRVHYWVIGFDGVWCDGPTLS